MIQIAYDSENVNKIKTIVINHKIVAAGLLCS